MTTTTFQKQVLAKLSAYDKILERIVDRLGTNDTFQKHILSKLEANDTFQKYVLSKLEANDKFQEHVLSKLTALSNAQDQIFKRLTSLEKTQEYILGKLAVNDKFQEHVLSKLTALSNDISGLREDMNLRFRVVDDRFAQLYEDLEDMRSSMTNLQHKVDELDENMEEHRMITETKFDSLVFTFGHEKRIQGLEKRVAVLEK